MNCISGALELFKTNSCAAWTIAIAAFVLGVLVMCAICCALLCVVVFVMPGFRDFFKAYPLILPVYAALLGILMVSGIPYLHAGRFLMSVKRNPKRLILLVLVILAAAVFRYNGVAAVVTLYVLSGPVTGIYNLLSRKGTSGA